MTDDGIACLLGLTRLRRLALCCTGIGDAALDYLTYYTRFAEVTPSLTRTRTPTLTLALTLTLTLTAHPSP